MHVLVIPSWYPTSEAPQNGIYFVEQARCLDRHGLQVGVVYPEQQSLRRASWTAVQKKYFQTEWTDEQRLPTLRRYGWNVWWRFPPGIRLRVRTAVCLAGRYMDRHGIPDVIHAQSGRWAGAAAARVREQYSIPYVLTEHFSGFQRDCIDPWRWPIIEEGYKHASAVASVSTGLKQTLIEAGLGTNSTIDVHPNLAQTPFFTLPPRDRSTPPPFRVVTVSRLDPSKNVSGLLKAVARISKTDRALSLHIVGDGPERNLLEHKARRLGITDWVTFHGRLDRRSVRSALWDAHAFVLPSTHETFGVVLLEAMATGLPVLATACGGPEDIITPNTGLLVPPGDTDALTDGLHSLRKRWASFEARKIRSYVIDRYGPEPFVQRTRTLYHRAITEAS